MNKSQKNIKNLENTFKHLRLNIDYTFLQMSDFSISYKL